MSDEREPGCCPCCGSPLAVYGTEPGSRSYWMCTDHGRPVVILPPENVGWAATHARVQLIDLFDMHGLEAFADGLSFTDRLYDRLETTYQNVREHNRERHLAAADRDADGSQSGLGRWSA